ncbi:MAG: hypothetical protein CMF48_00700 [Legionellales bacterium]|nr:hypothetical protein [Legionellales bacterium]
MTEYIIVLGHEIEPNAVLSSQSESRLAAGIDLLEQRPQAKLILSGGKIKGYSQSIASVMRSRVGKIVSLSKILLESASLDTIGQMVFLKHLLCIDSKGARLTFVTHGWHSFKSALMAHSVFETKYAIDFHVIEPLVGRNIADTEVDKVYQFCQTFTPKELQVLDPVSLLLEKHPWYRGGYPHESLLPSYFWDVLERDKTLWRELCDS